MVEVVKQIFLGLVQGFSEFLPISSSGHLKLFQSLFGFKSTENSFISIMLHLGTLVAVFIVYHALIGSMIVEFFKLVKDLFTGRFRWSAMNETRRMVVMVFISTAVLLVMLIPFGSHNLMEYLEMLNEIESLIPLGIAFMVTGVLLIVTFIVNAKYQHRRTEPSVKDALVIGGAQCVATIAGISRSGSTMASGLLCGLSREYMVAYSFIMSIPPILAAAATEAKAVMESTAPLTVEVAPMVAGMLSAAIFGVLSIKAIQWLIKKDRYKLFGYYCLTLGVLVIILSLAKVI